MELAEKIVHYGVDAVIIVAVIVGVIWVAITRMKSWN